MSGPVYECLDAVELVELTAGDLAVERLEEMLDHVEDCEACAGIVQTLVALKANRDEALEILRRAKIWKGRRRG